MSEKDLVPSAFQYVVCVRENLDPDQPQGCLYDDECINLLHMCIDGRCQFAAREGHPCRLVKRYQSQGSVILTDSCKPYGKDVGLYCDPFLNRCITRGTAMESSRKACRSDADCKITQFCRQNADNSTFSVCVEASSLDDSCSRYQPCKRPFICDRGICKAPCFTSADCYIGRKGKHRYVCDSTNVCQIVPGSPLPDSPEANFHFSSLLTSNVTRTVAPPLSGCAGILNVEPERPLLAEIDYRETTLLFKDGDPSSLLFTRLPVHAEEFKCTGQPQTPSYLYLFMIIVGIAFLMLVVLILVRY